MKTYQLFINGAYVDPASNEWFETIDPYRGEPISGCDVRGAARTMGVGGG